MAAAVDAAKEKSKPSDWTTKIPMVDVEAALKTVNDIHDKAVETAAMSVVAKALGYAGATSSPFYRRVTAARLFNLLSQRSALTQTARDYIRPDDEGMKSAVVVGAINQIPLYVDLIGRYMGKKLNVDLVRNAITKECNLTDACALICAKAFESSLKFAGMIGPDGTVQATQFQPVLGHNEPARDQELPPKSKNGTVSPPPRHEVNDTQEQLLYLDKEKSRSFSFVGPLEITRSEFERICKWLEFTMMIIDADNESKP